MRRLLLTLLVLVGFAAPVAAQTWGYPVRPWMDYAVPQNIGGTNWLVAGGWTIGDGIDPITIFCVNDKVWDSQQHKYVMGQNRGCWNPFMAITRQDVYDVYTDPNWTDPHPWNLSSADVGVLLYINLDYFNIPPGDYYVFTYGVRFENNYPIYTPSNVVEFTF